MSKNRKVTVLILKVKGDNICENALKKRTCEYIPVYLYLYLILKYDDI